MNKSLSKPIDGGVCAAKGFRAAGVPAEIKYKGRNDVALLVADSPCAAAAVFTTNKVAAAPVLYDRKTVAGGKIQAILANSGCANACTGEAGLKDAEGNTIGGEIPLHISRFFPRFHMTDRDATSVKLVYRLADVARERLRYVYTGNC